LKIPCQSSPVKQTFPVKSQRSENWRTAWWARELCPGEAIPMACLYKPPHLHTLNVKVFWERLQTAAADNRLSRDCRHAHRTSNAVGIHRPNPVIDRRGLIASPPIGPNPWEHDRGGTSRRAPAGLQGRRQILTCTGRAAGGSAAMPPPSDEVARIGRPADPGLSERNSSIHCVCDGPAPPVT